MTCALALALMLNYQQATFNERFGQWYEVKCVECSKPHPKPARVKPSDTRKQPKRVGPLKVPTFF